VNYARDYSEHVKGRFILGKSVAINPSNIKNFHHAVVGISLKEGIDIKNSEPYELPNEKVMDRLIDNFDGWTMPYIVSGVGKAWGDIIAEMHINDIDDMEEHAKTIRDIDGVRSTKTFAMTGMSFNKPFLVTEPRDFDTIYG
jgi:hypothetical protein